jgi:hypothetical protein
MFVGGARGDFVSWIVPMQIKLTMMHLMQLKHEPGLVRSNTRETSRVVRRPDHGELRVTVQCKHCGREGVFVIQDRETTWRLRRGSVICSVAGSAVLLISTASMWIISLAKGTDDSLFLLLAFVMSLIFAPPGLYLAFDPTGKIGVEVPKMIDFDSGTRREGLTWTSGDARRGPGLACSGKAAAA